MKLKYLLLLGLTTTALAQTNSILNTKNYLTNAYYGTIILSNTCWTNEYISQYYVGYTNLQYAAFPVRNQTNILTLTNRPYIYMGNSAIIRVIDKEWSILTNSYSRYIKTNQLIFNSDE